MTHIANVNGKDIYSDKQMAGITNTRVIFTDGSWCDVNTGEVHNTGSGDINIGGTANTASLTVMGSGDIRVAHVQQRPMESVMGSGDIRVRRVG